MCKNVIALFSLLVLISGFSNFTEAQVKKGKYPPGHPSNYVESAALRRTGSQAAAKKSATDIFGIQLTWDGIDKWETDWSPDGKMLAYTDDFDDIWIILPDGSNPNNLTENISGECYYPCFMPGSQGVMFTRYDENTERNSLEVVDLQKNHYVLLENAYAGCWSRDGLYLAYRIDSTDELAVLDFETGQTKIIAEGDDGYGSSCFNPSGKYVITSKEMENGSQKLFSIPRDGGEHVQLTFGEGIHDYPDFSPVGEWIVYTDLETLTLFAYSNKTRTSSEVFPDTYDMTLSGSFSPGGDTFCYILGQYNTTTGSYSNELFVAEFPFGGGTVSSDQSIVFASDRDGNREIYVMNPDGSNQTNLTSNSALDEYPSWSPDGSKIVFDTNRDGNRELYTMNSDGSNLNRLTNNSSTDMEATWSPDGTKIAFLAGRDGNAEIYVMNEDGSNPTRLTTSPASDDRPFWSPDGTKIAFSSNRDGNHAVFVMNSDGSNQTNLTNNSNADAHPSWSPDGSKIAFYSDRDGNAEIYVMNTDGSNQIRITNNTYNDYRPSWSPDGSKIAFHSDRDGNNEVYVMNADGSNQTRLTNNSAKDYFPSWARPVYVPSTGKITLTSPIGGEEFFAGSDLEVEWNSSSVEAIDIFLSLDGGGSWIPIAKSYDAGAGYLVWTIPDDFESGNCLVRIVDRNNAAIEDISDAVFSISKSTTEKYIEIYSPQGGEMFQVGTNITISWSMEGVSEISIAYSVDGGTSWNFIDTMTVSSIDWGEYSYDWEVPGEVSTNCLISVRDINDTQIRGRSEVFSITSGDKGFITLLHPSGGEEFTSGSALTIEWDSQDVAQVDIYYSTDGFTTLEVIKLGVNAQDGSFTWQIPGGINSSDCYIAVFNPENTDMFGFNNQPFKITSGAAYITLISPMDGEVLQAGSTYTIQWESAGVNNVDIEVSWDDWATSSFIAEGVNALDGSYQWKIPGSIESTYCYIWIGDPDNDSVFAENEQPFTITSGGGQQPAQIFMFPTNNMIQLSSPAVGNDGTIYIGSMDMHLYAVNPDGSEKWRHELDSEIWASPAIAKDGTIYIGSFSGSFYAINHDGSRKWRRNAGDAILSSAAIGIDGTVYFGAMSGWFYAYNADGSPQWGKEIGNPIISSPAIGIDGTIYFGDDNGVLHALNPDGTNKWIRNTNQGLIFSSPAIGGDGTIYIGTSEQGYLFAINPGNGSVKWARRLGESYAVESSPAIGTDGTIYVGSSFGNLFALDPTDGTILWQRPTGGQVVSSPAVGVDGTIYVGADDGRALAITPDGQINASFQTNGTIWSSPSIGKNGEIYIGSEDGNLYAIDSLTGAGLANSSWPKFRYGRKNLGNVAGLGQANIRVNYPDGGESLAPGGEIAIEWWSRDVSKVRIEYSTDNGQTYNIIVEGIAATNRDYTVYTWVIPDDINSAECLILISDMDNPNIKDQSNDLFNITTSSIVEVTSPNGGEKWPLGSSQTITWMSSNVGMVKIIYSVDDGATWNEIISATDASTGEYTWTVPDGNENISENCKIRIIDAEDSANFDECDGIFSIISSNYIRITSPQIGDRWTVGSQKEITWEFSGVVGVKIEFSTDDGATWSVVEGSFSASTGSYPWTLPSSSYAQCRLRLSDTTNPDISDTSERFEIISPELTIVHTPVASANETDEITFTAQITSNSQISSVYLYHDVTGNRVFDKLVEMKEAGGDNYSVTLTVGEFTALGMEYYITAKDSSNQKSRAPDDGFYSINALIGNIQSTDKITGGSEQNSYRMISIPLNLNQTSIEEQLAGLLPDGKMGTDWRVFRFSPGETTPGEYPNIEGFAPGLAFWIIAKKDFTLKSSSGSTVTTSEEFMLTLAPEWNDIANPWMYDISWLDVENPSGTNLDIYTYDGKWSNPTSIGQDLILEPWEGYSVYNYSNINVIIKFNPKKAGATAKPAVTAGTEQWRITLKASAGLAEDSANHLGVRTDAKVEWDKYDHVEPPPVGKYVSVNFPHRDWSQYPYDYTVDFRPHAETISWDFNVKTNISRETVTVELMGVEQLPEGASLMAVDLDSGRQIDIENGSFSFVSGNNLTVHHYRLFVSSSAEFEPILNDSRPEQFVTARCYPNPFNPQTTIQYELSSAAQVTISIYNSAGQRVQNHKLGYKNPGIHELVFNAAELTSGLYIFRIDAGYLSATGKMLYMK
ncbi:PQQ-binding-like beta-propeller repeat protein [Candidatus Latescibacterota bacterium]